MAQMIEEMKAKKAKSAETQSGEAIEITNHVKKAQEESDIEVIVTSRKEDKGEKTVKFGDEFLSVRETNSPEDLRYVPSECEYIDNKGLLSDVAKFINTRTPVLIEGETGVGKTSAFRYLAYKTQTPYRRMNLNGSTTVDEFVGKILLDKEGTYWVDGILIDAMRKGHWLICDEINAALPEILFVLHSLLDDDGFVVLADKGNEVVRPHENFRLFATMNPSDGGYTGTKDLNTAFLDRFVKMTFDFPTLAQERKMVEKRYPNLNYVTSDKLTNMIKYAGEMRTAYGKGAQEFLVSPRGLLQWVQMAEVFKDVLKSAEYTLVNKAPIEERSAIRDVLKLRFGLGLHDYIAQCTAGKLYRVGDEVVVTIPEGQNSNVAGEYVGLYTVVDVQEPPVREGETAVDIERIAYEVKCTAKNQKEEPLGASGTRVRLGQLLTAQYHGDTGLMS